MGTKNRFPVTAVETSKIRSQLPGGLAMNMLAGLTSSRSSMSLSFARPIASSCSPTDDASRARGS